MSETPGDNSFECMQVQLIEHFGADPKLVCNLFDGLASRTNAKNFKDGDWSVAYPRDGVAHVWVRRGGNLNRLGYELEPDTVKTGPSIEELVEVTTLKIMELLHKSGSRKEPYPERMIVRPTNKGRISPKTGSSGR